MPGHHAGGLGKERGQCIGTDAVRAAAVGCRPLSGDDLAQQCLHLRVTAQRGGDNAVSIQIAWREQGTHVGKIADLQHAPGVFVQVTEDARCRLFQCGAFRVIVHDGVQRQAWFLEVQVGIHDTGTRPLHGRQNLGHADLPVAVAVQQCRCSAIKLQPGGGAVEHRPQFGVQLRQIAQVVAAAQCHLIKAARAEEAPFVTFDLRAAHDVVTP